MKQSQSNSQAQEQARWLLQRTRHIRVRVLMLLLRTTTNTGFLGLACIGLHFCELRPGTGLPDITRPLLVAGIGTWCIYTGVQLLHMCIDSVALWKHTAALKTSMETKLRADESRSKLTLIK